MADDETPEHRPEETSYEPVPVEATEALESQLETGSSVPNPSELPEGTSFGFRRAAEKVRSFPQTPGVYLMKDEAGRVIYIGKAKNLRSRAGSYFLKAARWGAAWSHSGLAAHLQISHMLLGHYCGGSGLEVVSALFARLDQAMHRTLQFADLKRGLSTRHQTLADISRRWKNAFAGAIEEGDASRFQGVAI